MKSLIALGLFSVAVIGAPVWAAGPAPATQAAAASVLSGEVLEVLDVDIYTYVRLKTKDGETWAAVQKAPLKKGATITIQNPMTMRNFESKSLKRTFPSIVFGSLGGTNAVGMGTGAASAMMDPAHANSGKAMPAPVVKVAKATGANAYTVGEVAGKAAVLKDKPVQVRGQVVKYSEGIMGKNWAHLRDGTGDAANGSNDLLVTTKDQTKVGEVILVNGTVRTDKDFGAGYSYKVLVEDASIKR